MRRTEAIAWVVSVCAGCLRLSQAKALSILVAAALRVERASLANLGRAAAGSAKHQIKRAWRFCANERVEPADAMRGVVRRALRKRKKPLLVALDWVDVRGFQTLVAAAVLKGRAVPLCWASCRGHVYDGHRSRNAFEESLLRLDRARRSLVLRSMVPRVEDGGPRVIVLADRGFGRTELARFCQAQGFDYVIRIEPDVHVRCASYAGKLIDYPVHKGVCKVLRHVAYRSHHPVTQNVVVRWVRGLPPRRDECWFLMSSLTAGGARVSRLYAQRMTIEELFRDHKSKRNGWGLRDIQLTRPDRLDRLLLVLAIAYLLLCGIGLVAVARCKPADWCANSKGGTCSVVLIGRLMLKKLKCSAAQAFAAFLRASEEAVPKWG